MITHNKMWQDLARTIPADNPGDLVAVIDPLTMIPGGLPLIQPDPECRPVVADDPKYGPCLHFRDGAFMVSK